MLSGTGKDVQVMENQVTLRFAVPDDAAAIRSIYEPYVLNTAVTSEYYVPTEEEFRARITRTRERYPYIVAVKDGQIIGYIYASPLSPRHAYSWAAETSIYIRQNVRRTGAGSRLYKALSAICRKQNVLNLYVICTPFTGQLVKGDFLCAIPMNSKNIALTCIGKGNILKHLKAFPKGVFA